MCPLHLRNGDPESLSDLHQISQQGSETSKARASLCSSWSFISKGAPPQTIHMSRVLQAYLFCFCANTRLLFLPICFLACDAHTPWFSLTLFSDFVHCSYSCVEPGLGQELISPRVTGYQHPLHLSFPVMSPTPPSSY